jgi:D-arabinose 1-dehydrogenase-like Zn-dependent alcohol dehydrogenase
MTPKFIGARVDGGYGDHVIVPHARYLVDYEGVPRNLACTYACAGLTAYGALMKVAPLTEDDHFLIVGAGGVGLSAVHIARAVMRGKLIVAEVDATKRAAARQAGAVETIDNSEPGAVEHLLEMTGGGVAASLDFVGMPVTSGFAIDCLRKGGTHVVVGLYGDALSLPLPQFPFKMMTLRGSFTGTLDELKALMDLVKAGKVPPIPVEPRPLEEAQQTLTDLREGRVLGRVVLNP